ncbi:uncharacterized protein [Euwallacea fornicatus]|uniref:uncharacterized protein isoform X2 n=1 Tax=Euwallacea fornicatus TaxID=995702 RepID=UPI0033902008
MKRKAEEPPLLPNVMEAIASMKKRTGSTQKHIIGHISQQLSSTNTYRNMDLEVRRALEYGLRMRLIKQIPGKYFLVLNKSNDAVCRKFSGPNDCSTSSKRERPRKRRSHSKRRKSKIISHHSSRKRLSNENGIIDDAEPNRGMTVTPEPLNKSKRRRGKKTAECDTKGRSGIAADDSNSRTSEVDYKNSKTAFFPDNKCLDQEKPECESKKDDNNRERDNQESDQNQDDVGYCGDPRCLCSIKQEDGCSRSVSKENGTSCNDSSLN